jgi:hypothetical protein
MKGKSIYVGTVPSESIRSVLPHKNDSIGDSCVRESNCNGKEEMTEEEILGKLHPDATKAECKRFLRARDGDVEAASIKLTAYLEWRNIHMLDQKNNFDNSKVDSQEDLNRWRQVAEGAVAMSGRTTKEKRPLPRLVSIHESDIDCEEAMLARDGTRVVQVLPAQLDQRLAVPSTYALAVAMYLDSILDRNSEECITVVIDVRGGNGWANPRPTAVIPFIKTVSRLLADNFPERLKTCILFPLPRAANVLWNLIKGFLDPDTVNKIKIVTGAAWNHSPPPNRQLIKFMDEKLLLVLEERRLKQIEEALLMIESES